MSRHSIAFRRLLLAALAAALLLPLGACSDSGDDDDVFQFGDLWVVTTGNRLIGFNESNPLQPRRILSVTGLQGGEELLAIDFRPADGRLYGLGSNGRIYSLNTRNGFASLACRLSASGTGLMGADFGIDFNPVPDRLRIVSDAEQNLRVQITAGGVCNVNTDSPLTPAGAVVAAAYTNSLAGARSTTLYGIDAISDTLVRIGANPATGGGCPADTGNPNCGVVAAVGPLGVDASGLAGFDVDAVDGSALAALNVAGESRLYRIDLAGGGASLVGRFGSGETVRGLARVPAEVTVFGVTDTNTLVRFAPGAPQTVASIGAVAGLQAAENVLAIDFRPSDGELYALGSTGRIYQLSTGTGGVVASRVLGADPGDGTSPFTALNGTAFFGMDFNAAANRLRVVSNEEQNLRINVDVANGVITDGNLNPAGHVVAAAYTNNFDGAAATQLFVIDSGDDSLKLQSPDTGALTGALPLGVAVEDSALNAFDIAGGHNGMALAALRVGGQSNLYGINLATGAATPITAGPIGGGTPVNIRAMAIRVE